MFESIIFKTIVSLLCLWGLACVFYHIHKLPDAEEE